MRSASAAACCLVAALFACIPGGAHAQWSGPSYAYDAPNYVVINSRSGDAGTSFTPGSGGFTRAQAGITGQTGTAEVKVKFKATYTSTPGTPAKNVYAKHGRAGNVGGTGDGSGTAASEADFTPTGHASQTTPPNCNETVSVGGEIISGDTVVLHFWSRA